MTTLDEMWQRLTEHQPYADKYGYGATWMVMCKVRKREAANIAADTLWHMWDACGAIKDAVDGAAYAAAYVASATIHVRAAVTAIARIEEAEQAYDNA